MAFLLFKSLPFKREAAALALEAGVDGLIVAQENVAEAAALSRCPALPESAFAVHSLVKKSDELAALAGLKDGQAILLKRGWAVIPVENLLAGAGLTQTPAGAGWPKASGLTLEAGSLAEARLAAGILQRGADAVALLPETLPELAALVREFKQAASPIDLVAATVTEVRPAGLGHRVCVDATTLLESGQGLLLGNSAAFTFLVQAETEANAFVNTRPFRVNAGAVHGYVFLADGRTAYLSELAPGAEVLVADAAGECRAVTVGRVKVEQRPLLLLRAQSADGAEGSVFLQNAETVHLLQPGGQAVSVAVLEPGMRVLCRLVEAGRHFGMPVKEDIQE